MVDEEAVVDLVEDSEEAEVEGKKTTCTFFVDTNLNILYLCIHNHRGGGKTWRMWRTPWWKRWRMWCGGRHGGGRHGGRGGANDGIAISASRHRRNCASVGAIFFYILSVSCLVSYETIKHLNLV